MDFHSSCSMYVCNFYLLAWTTSQLCPLTVQTHLCTTLSPALFWVLSVEHLFSCVGNEPKNLIQGQKAAEARPPTQPHCLSPPCFLPHTLPPAVHQAANARTTLGDDHIQGSILRQSSRSHPEASRGWEHGVSG